MTTVVDWTQTNPQVEVSSSFSSQVPAFSGSHQLQWQLCSIPSFTSELQQTLLNINNLYKLILVCLEELRGWKGWGCRQQRSREECTIVITWYDLAQLDMWMCWPLHVSTHKVKSWLIEDPNLSQSINQSINQCCRPQRSQLQTNTKRSIDQPSVSLQSQTTTTI